MNRRERLGGEQMLERVLNWIVWIFALINFWQMYGLLKFEALMLGMYWIWLVNLAIVFKFFLIMFAGIRVFEDWRHKNTK